jgi:hypothetical protein
VIVEEKTAVGTESILAQVTLGSAGRFATLDDLIVLAERASDTVNTRPSVTLISADFHF